jgi:cobalt-zinc-cadmium efflux system membrane fusion protein
MASVQKTLVILVEAAAVVGAVVLFYHFAAHGKPAPEPAEPPASAGRTVELGEEQLKSVRVEAAVERSFTQEEGAVGRIDFNADKAIQVFPPYQGKIIAALHEEGDEVKAGEPLYTLDSPDLIQAESTLISASGVQALTAKTLARDRDVYATKGLSERELDQAVSDQQAAEGALKAARDAVRLFGKSEAEIDRIVATRKIDSALVVPSPISGVVTARNAAPGSFAQPGAVPAPYAVADVSSMWLIASVAESDIPRLQNHAAVKVRVQAWPGKVFEGHINVIGAAVDSNTHRITVRSELPDPGRLLRPGMLATFAINTGAPAVSTAVPEGGIVREGDGTMTVWVTSDRRTFEQRTVEIGLQQEGFDQILTGVKTGELVATDGALFLDSAYALKSE